MLEISMKNTTFEKFKGDITNGNLRFLKIRYNGFDFVCFNVLDCNGDVISVLSKNTVLVVILKRFIC